MYIYHCEDSLEGIFTAIYNTYEDRKAAQDTYISTTGDYLLFSDMVTVHPDKEKTIKVMNTLKRKFGEEDYLRLCMALAAPDDEKANAVYHTIAEGLSGKCRPGHLFDNLARKEIHHTFSLARGVNNEFMHLRGFVRFQELENDILYSKIGPRNNVLTFLMPHFADRFPLENFMIYDEERNFFGVHPSRQGWYLVQGNSLDQWRENLSFSEEELQYQELFRYFCNKIAINERKNIKLQRNMLPLRFQEYMVEFN